MMMMMMIMMTEHISHRDSSEMLIIMANRRDRLGEGIHFGANGRAESWIYDYSYSVEQTSDFDSQDLTNITLLVSHISHCTFIAKSGYLLVPTAEP